MVHSPHEIISTCLHESYRGTNKSIKSDWYTETLYLQSIFDSRHKTRLKSSERNDTTDFSLFVETNSPDIIV